MFVLKIKEKEFYLLDTTDNTVEKISKNMLDVLVKIIDIDTHELYGKKLARARLINGYGMRNETAKGREYSILYDIDNPGITVKIEEGVDVIEKELIVKLKNKGVENIEFPSTLIYM